MREVLGMRLEDALALYRADGVEPTVTITHAPRDQRNGGTLRVIRAGENEVTVGVFMDDVPKQ